jgi:hypothetical protein
MSNSSDRNGRALEYIVVKEIEQQLLATQVDFTPRALQAQLKDQQKYFSLSVNSQQNYKKCAERIYQWLQDEFSISNQQVEIDRLSDQDAKKGDPTDIKITAGLTPINLSIKHNHTALKHQRPSSTAQHCGYPTGTSEDIQFRKYYKEIARTFYEIAQSYSYFRDLETGRVLQHLYVPMCELVAQSINHWATSPHSPNHLFTFLVGKTDFHKIIFNELPGELKIQTFNSPQFVKSVVARNQSSYVELEFSNFWKISMRLHTASSQITVYPSLKFDTQLNNCTIVPERKICI